MRDTAAIVPLPIKGWVSSLSRKEEKGKDYAFRRQVNEKPSVILGCPGPPCLLKREGTASFTVRRHIPVPVFVLTTLHGMQPSGGS